MLRHMSTFKYKQAQETIANMKQQKTDKKKLCEAHAKQNCSFCRQQNTDRKRPPNNVIRFEESAKKSGKRSNREDLPNK